MKKTITILPSIKGCYGQRIYIPVEKREVISLFDTISVWRQGERDTEEGKEILFELPFRMDIRDNPLIIYALNKSGLIVEDAINFVL